ncbi:hypothetical protein Tco_1014477, partial [Tanacetum coccineum]
LNIPMGIMTQAEEENVAHTLEVVDEVEVKEVVGTTRKTKVSRSANRLYKAQIKVGKEGTNEVGRESDKEENSHSSLERMEDSSLGCENGFSKWYRSLTRKGLRGDQAREICNEDLKRSWYGRLQSSFMSNGTGTQVVKSNQKLKLLNIKKCPRESHARAMKQILRYLKGTTSFGIKYKRGNAMRLVGYSGHNVDIDDGRSTTGYVFYLGTSPITWCSQKQTTVVLSSCEAKFMAATAAACQAIWLREVLAEVTVNEQVIVEHVCEENQRLDPLTKALACIRFKEMRSLLGVQELPSSTQKFRG